MEISTDVWVYALIRRVELAGAFATVARKGDARAGAVLVKTFDKHAGDLQFRRLHAEPSPHSDSPCRTDDTRPPAI